MINRELYMPEMVEIKSIDRECPLVNTYALAANEQYKPGQFFQVSVLGVGEIPISVSSSYPADSSIEVTVRKTGKVTRAIHNLSKGDFVGLRGPYGNSFPIEEAAGKNLLLVAGGTGLAPLRSVIRHIINKRTDYGRVCLLYGAKKKDEMLFLTELTAWSSANDIEVHLTIDKAEADWNGHVGVVTTLLYNLDFNFRKCFSFVCGPPVMIRFSIQCLSEQGVGDKSIFVTLERCMKCGVGKCGHCYIENKYVCTDGPVFSFHEIKGFKGAGGSFIL